MSDSPSAIVPLAGLRQPVSGLSHFGAAAVASGLVIQGFWELFGAKPMVNLVVFGVFGLTMVLLFLASSAYHFAPSGGRWLARLRKLDHMMIYIFIAGSYTPVCALILDPRKGLILGTFVWIVALAGAALKLFWVESSRWVRIGMYVLLSLFSVVALPDIWQRLPTSGLYWLTAGGAAYLVGALIYATRWPDPFPKVFGFHEIWHLFVALGSFCHFIVMRYFVVA